MPKQAVGTLVREWRMQRHRSQLDLALEVGVSARHLSFVETGRANPSPELVLALAGGLDVPLRERNTLLLAAGYAPRYQETSLDDPAMAMMHAAIQRLLDAHDPYPGLVIDRHWNVVLTNRAATVLVTGLPVDLLGPPLNVYRVCLHPDGLASRTRNFPAWATYLLHQLRRSVVLTNDPSLAALQDEVNAYPNVAGLTAQRGAAWEDPPILVPVELDLGGTVVSLFTTLTTFGTPRDITLDELAVELFFPADDQTAALLRSS
ncbi:MAG TPA: helix-turn-helix transcriptional regulator [Acidimicrobiales bacterium]|nr:helix-turn-helix transcriptional regulator [Acidimicrobiales bacterium]